jgi:hypothetical protein
MRPTQVFLQFNQATRQCRRIPRNSVPRDCSSLGTLFCGQPSYIGWYTRNRMHNPMIKNIDPINKFPYTIVWSSDIVAPFLKTFPWPPCFIPPTKALEWSLCNCGLAVEFWRIINSVKIYYKLQTDACPIHGICTTKRSLFIYTINVEQNGKLSENLEPGEKNYSIF